MQLKGRGLFRISDPPQNKLTAKKPKLQKAIKVEIETKTLIFVSARGIIEMTFRLEHD